MDEKQYYRRMREAGLCVRCQKQDAVPGMSMCGDCLYDRQMYNLANREKISQHRKAVYAQRKAAGICVHCGNPAKPGKTECPKCANKNRVACVVYKNRVHVSQCEPGICRRKGCEKPVMPEKCYCADHYPAKVETMMRNQYRGVDHPWRKGGKHDEIATLVGRTAT